MGMWINEAQRLLVSVARDGSVVQFGDFVDLVEARSGVPGTGHPMWMHKVLQRVARICLKQGQPILSALCINADGTVAGGYAQALPSRGEGIDVEQHAALERQRCYRHYKNQPDNSVNRRGRQRTPKQKKPSANSKQCPDCRKSVPADGQGRLDNHFQKGGVPCPGGRAPAKSRTHPCRICGQKNIPVNNKGALRLHNAKGRNGMVECPGSYLIVAPGKRRRGKQGNDPVNRALPASPSAATTGRLNDTAKSSPNGVRKVIGGGSPGLGKNAK